ncbi:MAG: dihydroorotase [Treponema sp.]|jgi:dihydroorotase|nr:dihydroorotase [Treponema sp.]
MKRTIILKNFRIVDENVNMLGSVIVEDGIIREVFPGSADFSDSGLSNKELDGFLDSARIIIDGGEGADKWGLSLLPALTDIHAHFRDPGFPEKENLESAALAAVAGGYGTVVCMANTDPVIDAPEAAAALKLRSDALGLIDLYPAMALTTGMAGKELSGITRLQPADSGQKAAWPGQRPRRPPLILSEDGKDISDDALLLRAFQEAKRLGLPVSCHCDEGGETKATARVIELGKKAGCHVHIAHVSTKEAVALIRGAKAEAGNAESGFTLTCEASPHHLVLTDETARMLGEETWGKVNPPLRPEADRQALLGALLDGTIDAIATDHAPHSNSDKKKGAPGFSGLETAFSICLTELVSEEGLSLSRLSSLLSASPSRILGLGDRGRIAPGYRADFFITDTDSFWQVDPANMKTRGKNSPFTGRDVRGRILMTIHRGRIVYEAPALK